MAFLTALPFHYVCERLDPQSVVSLVSIDKATRTSFVYNEKQSLNLFQHLLRYFYTHWHCTLLVGLPAFEKFALFAAHSLGFCIALNHRSENQRQMICSGVVESRRTVWSHDKRWLVPLAYAFPKPVPVREGRQTPNYTIYPPSMYYSNTNSTLFYDVRFSRRYTLFMNWSPSYLVHEFEDLENQLVRVFAWFSKVSEVLGPPRTYQTEICLATIYLVEGSVAHKTFRLPFRGYRLCAASGNYALFSRCAGPPFDFSNFALLDIRDGKYELIDSVPAEFSHPFVLNGLPCMLGEGGHVFLPYFRSEC